MEDSRDRPQHVPVLLDRVVELVAPALEHDGSVLVDATLGLGGHAEAVLERCPLARVVGLDRDRAALDRATARLTGFGDRFTPVHAVYDEILDVLDRLGLRRVDAVLFDLGVSSMQLDVREREQQPFTSSARLVELLYSTIPAPARRTGGHPAKRTFQALRIEVNDELGVLRRALPAAVDAVAVGGRVVVMSYHSLEDRLVKAAFTDRTRSTVPEDLPVVPAGHEPELRLLTRGAEKAGAEETETNPRAASVRLRAVERMRERVA